MKRLSLYNVIFGIFALSFLLVGVLIYFSVTNHQQDLFQAAIDEKIKLAQTMPGVISGHHRQIGSAFWHSGQMRGNKMSF